MRLSERLRNETHDAHRRAERSGVMRLLLRGELARPVYVSLLLELRAIYAALESALAPRAGEAPFSRFALASLARVPSLDADIAAFGADAEPALADATRAYVDRIHVLAAATPELLLSHAYVRYMGDLSGGQLLAPIVARSFALDDGRGTAFYDFGPRLDPDDAKYRFRDALDALPADLADAFVNEAKLAFAMHERVFEAVAR